MRPRLNSSSAVSGFGWSFGFDLQVRSRSAVFKLEALFFEPGLSRWLSESEDSILSKAVERDVELPSQASLSSISEPRNYELECRIHRASNNF